MASTWRLRTRKHDRDFLLGEHLVQPHLNTILINGQAVKLEPQVMKLLLYLADHCGELLLKEEVIRQVWGKKGDEALLREALSELLRVFNGNVEDGITLTHWMFLRFSAPEGTKS